MHTSARRWEEGWTGRSAALQRPMWAPKYRGRARDRPRASLPRVTPPPSGEEGVHPTRSHRLDAAGGNGRRIRVNTFGYLAQNLLSLTRLPFEGGAGGRGLICIATPPALLRGKPNCHERGLLPGKCERHGSFSQPDPLRVYSEFSPTAVSGVTPVSVDTLQPHTSILSILL